MAIGQQQEMIAVLEKRVEFLERSLVIMTAAAERLAEKLAAAREKLEE